MFTFKQFSVDDGQTAMKVGTDGVLIGAWAAGGNKILDVGTGSGLITLMMAQRFPDAEIVGIDIDKDACLQAKANAEHSPFANRITIINSSLQDYARIAEQESFDSIVSNPPYFQKSLKSPNAKRTIARHNDTLSFRELMKCSKLLLKEGGKLSVIGPANAKEDLESEAIIIGLTIRKSVLIKSKLNKAPNRFMTLFSNNDFESVEENNVCLLNEDGSRSEWYRNLTKDFYMK